MNCSFINLLCCECATFFEFQNYDAQEINTNEKILIIKF